MSSVSTTNASVSTTTPQPARKYPPVALAIQGTPALSNTFTVTGQSYGNGVYQTSQSSFPTENVGWLWHNALNGSSFSSRNAYGSTGDFTGTETTVVDGTSHKGEWIQVKFPQGLAVKTWVYTHRIGDPAAFVIAGSNDGVTWKLILHQTVNLFTAPALAASGNVITIPVNSPTTYIYCRMICLKTTGYVYFDGHAQTIYATE